MEAESSTPKSNQVKGRWHSVMTTDKHYLSVYMGLDPAKNAPSFEVINEE